MDLLNSTKNDLAGRLSFHLNLEVQAEWDYIEILVQIHNNSLSIIISNG